MDTSPSPVRHSGVSNVTKAALYMTAAAICFGLMNVLVRVASENVPTMEVVFFRNVFALIAMMPWLASAGLGGLRTSRMKLHIARSVVGVVSMIIWFAALVHVPLANAVALNFTLPLFILLGAALLLGESVGPRRWIATAVGFSGMLVILRPGFTDISIYSTLPVLAAVFMASSMLLLKLISAHDRAGTAVAMMNLLMTPLSLVPALFVWRWPGLADYGVLALLGLSAMAAHLFLARAFAQADASVVSLFDYTRLPFVALFAWLLFGETAEIWTWIGAAIIIGSSIYIARREAADEKKARTLELTQSARDV